MIMLIYSLNNQVFNDPEQLYIAIIPPLSTENFQKEKSKLDSLDSISYGLFGLILLIFILLDITWRKHCQKPKVKQEKIWAKIPCAYCRYFQKNPYLKCAVNPSKVLTSEAINCLDFEGLSK